MMSLGAAEDMQIGGHPGPTASRVRQGAEPSSGVE